MTLRKGIVKMNKSIIAILIIMLCNSFLMGCETFKENSDVSSAPENDFVSIDVDVKTMEVGGHMEYGPYDLKEGNKISCNLNWSNADGNLYIAVGTKFGAFNNGLIASGTGVCLLDESIEIKEAGTYYIYIGSQNTDMSDVEDIEGSIDISKETKKL